MTRRERAALWRRASARYEIGDCAGAGRLTDVEAATWDAFVNMEWEEQDPLGHGVACPFRATIAALIAAMIETGDA